MNTAADNPIDSITPFTLLDYPDLAACIVWFAGCNMRCGYCYNPQLVLGKGKLAYADALRFVKQRIGLLDGVVLSGGECTMAKDLPVFVRELKSLGFKVKLDTNGSNPAMLEALLKEHLIDFVSLDFKAPANKYFEVTSSRLYNRWESSIALLIEHTINFEVRTTFHEHLLTEQDLMAMSDILCEKGYNKTFYVQQFRNGCETLGGLGSNYKRFDPDSLTSSLKIEIRS